MFLKKVFYANQGSIYFKQKYSSELLLHITVK